MGSSKEDVRRVSIYINGDEADLTLSQLTQGTAKLKNELSHLTLGTEEYRQKMHQLADSRAVLADVKADIDKISVSLQDSKKQSEGMFGSFTRFFEKIGIVIGIEELISFGKELLEVAQKADGVAMAFSKIGNTVGLMDKLRASSRGLISDLDLQKIAVEANNANIPIAKLGMLLQFAEERAQDTGQDVTELTNKLITGLGKDSVKAVQGLGLDIREVKEEFHRTGDLVQAVSNVIKREMDESGEHVENLGEKLGKVKTSWANFMEGLGKIWKTIIAPEQANAEKVTDLVNEYMVGKFEHLEKLKDDELATAITNAHARIKKFSEETAKAEKETKNNKPGESLVDFSEKVDKLSAAKSELKAAQNELAAFNNESNNRFNKKGDGTIDALDMQISKLQTQQKELSKTSAEWKKFQAQIDDIEKQKDAITGKKPKGDKSGEEALRKAEQEKKAQEEYLTQSAALDAKLKEFNASELADTLSKNDKEVAALENKYDKEWTEATAALKKLRESKNANEEQIQKQQDAIDKLAGQKTAAVNLLREKQEKDITEKIKAIRAHLSDKIVSETQKEIDDINEKFDAMKKDAGSDPISQALADTGRQAALNDAKLNEAKRFEKEMERIQAEGNLEDSPAGIKTRLAAVDKKYAGELAALKANHTAEFQETVAFKEALKKLDKNSAAEKKKIEELDRKSYQQKAIDTAQGISNIVFSNEQNARDQQMNEQIKGLETEKNAQLSAKNLTAKQKADIEAKFAAQEADIKRKNWEANKMAMAEQALMNGALGLIKLWVDPGFPAAIPLAIGLGAEVAVQEAAILSQKTPAFAEGGYSAVDYTNPSGWVRRPTLFANSSSGRPFIAGEGNKSEYIVSSQQLRDPVVANFVGMMESNRTVKHFESGGYSSTGGSNSSSASSNQGSDRLDKVEYLLHAFIEKQAAINEIPVTFNTRAHDLYVARITQITNKATT